MAVQKKKPTKSATAKPAGFAPETPVPEEPSHIGAAILQIRKAWPSLTSAERDAFRSLATDEQRSDLGKQTKADAVLREAARWMVQLDHELRLHADLGAWYTPQRFAYFLERIHALHDRLAAERESDSKRTQKRDAAATTRDAAITVRKKLIRRLETFAGERDAERAAIEAAQGVTATNDDLARSLHALAALALDWLGRTDPASAVLAAQAGLTKDRAEEAIALGTDLEKAAAGATLEGPAAPRDTPLVNRDEGDVLLEMKTAMDLATSAREDNAAIRVPTPGPSVKHVLGGKRKAGRPKEDESGGK